MLHFSPSQLPILFGVLALLIVLIYKSRTLTARDILAGVVLAVLVFVVCTGQLSQVHVPDIAVHLFDGK